MVDGNVPVKIMQSYIDSIIFIAQGVKSMEDFFPIGFSYPPGMKTYGMSYRFSRIFGCVGLRFSWDYINCIFWVYENNERIKLRKKGVLWINAKVTSA